MNQFQNVIELFEFDFLSSITLQISSILCFFGFYVYLFYLPSKRNIRQGQGVTLKESCINFRCQYNIFSYFLFQNLVYSQNAHIEPSNFQ